MEKQNDGLDELRERVDNTILNLLDAIDKKLKDDVGFFDLPEVIKETNELIKTRYSSIV